MSAAPVALELVDTHCHLDYEYEGGRTPADLVRDAAAAGVTRMLTIATEAARVPAVQKISDSFPGVFHAVGVHPHEAAKMKLEDLGLLERAAAHPKCKAIGELGLDYYYKHSPPEAQATCLEGQLELATRLGKPVVVHARDAEADLLMHLTRYAKGLASGQAPGVIHCFSGTRAFGEACLELGFHLSFSGILTFKNAEELRQAAKAAPADRILVETDSPYLAPVPHRGRKCEPYMVRNTAEKLAEVRGVSIEEIARITTANATRLFSLS
ncbi:MAG: TatD family hydrolase [Bdellovibrionales bacterium]|nr:TatD family hydrolase [Bdellovibrionales bacterium]